MSSMMYRYLTIITDYILGVPQNGQYKATIFLVSALPFLRRELSLIQIPRSMAGPISQ